MSQQTPLLTYCRELFHHHDLASLTAEVGPLKLAPVRRNVATGASRASGGVGGVGGESGGSGGGSNEEWVENELVMSCPHFLNEIPGITTNLQEEPVGLQLLEENEEEDDLKEQHVLLEQQNIGLSYYRKYFYSQPHENLFYWDDALGPIAVSVKREEQVVDKGEDGESGCDPFWRIVFRASEVTLRGSISEPSVLQYIPATPSKKSSSLQPTPITSSKEILQIVFPFLKSPPRMQIQPPTPPPNSTTTTKNNNTLPSILLKLDEQGLTYKHKIGVLLCRANQQSEEEMYNNEASTPLFEEFLDFLGSKVRLKGFRGYSGGLDVKDDTTGTHTHYNSTTFPPYELMFHVSTLLPFTPNNRQQLMRKRHIGNDIVTIVFQEPGARPFTPRAIRSQFQHVFLVVRAVVGLNGETSYMLSISRSAQVPPFGPALTPQKYHKKDANFRNFLLAKIINAENATYRTEKFTTMVTRTRNEYLKDLYNNQAVGGGGGGNSNSNNTNQEITVNKRFSMLNLLKSSSSSSSSSKNQVIRNNNIRPCKSSNVPGALSWKLGDGGGLVGVCRKWIFRLGPEKCGGSGGSGRRELVCLIPMKSIWAWEVVGESGGGGGLTIYHTTFSSSSSTDANNSSSSPQNLLTSTDFLIPSPPQLPPQSPSTLNIAKTIAQKLSSLRPLAKETIQQVLNRRLNQSICSPVGIQQQQQESLGFHIQNDGLITDVDPDSPSGVAGVEPFSRVVKINGLKLTSTTTHNYYNHHHQTNNPPQHLPQQPPPLTPEQMIDLLKSSSPTIHLTLIPSCVVRHIPLPNSQQQQQQGMTINPIKHSGKEIFPTTNNHQNILTDDPLNWDPEESGSLSLLDNYYCSPRVSSFNNYLQGGVGTSKGTDYYAFYSSASTSSGYGTGSSSKSSSGRGGGGGSDYCRVVVSGLNRGVEEKQAQRQAPPPIPARCTTGNKFSQSSDNLNMLLMRSRNHRDEDNLNSRISALKNAYLNGGGGGQGGQGQSTTVMMRTRKSPGGIVRPTSTTVFDRELYRLIQFDEKETTTTPPNNMINNPQPSVYQQLPRHNHHNHHHHHQQQQLHQQSSTPPPLQLVLTTKSAPVTPQKKQQQQNNHNNHRKTASSSSTTPSTTNQQPTLLEARVALLEAQLAAEQQTKLHLVTSLDLLQRENRKLQLDYEGNKKDVERLKKALLFLD